MDALFKIITFSQNLLQISFRFKKVVTTAVLGMFAPPLVRSSVEWCATVEPRKTTCKAVLRCSCPFPRNGHKMPIYADTTTVKVFLSTVQHATFFGCITSKFFLWLFWRRLWL